jgi:hypothetical protein
MMSAAVNGQLNELDIRAHRKEHSMSDKPVNATPHESEASAAQPEAPQLQRRTAVRAGLVSLAGMLLAGHSQANAAPPAQETRCSTVNLPIVGGANTAIAQQSLSLLPASATAAFYTGKLLSDPTFQRFMRYFTDRGLNFFADRVQLFMGIRPYEAPTDATPALPFLIAVAPAAQSFAPGATSHEAASIVVLRERGVNTILAGSVVVSHRPYQISSFQVLELDATRQIAVRRVERSQLTALTANDLAALLGPPSINLSEWDGEIGALAPTDTVNMAAISYQTLLQASFDQGVYPPEALRSLVAESPLVQKLALAHGIRYQSAVAGAGGACCSCSTTCSCHGCTTSSSSSKKITSLQTPG